MTPLEEKPLVGFVAGTSKGGRERKPKVIQEIVSVPRKRPAGSTPSEVKRALLKKFNYTFIVRLLVISQKVARAPI